MRLRNLWQLLELLPLLVATYCGKQSAHLSQFDVLCALLVNLSRQTGKHRETTTATTE